MSNFVLHQKNYNAGLGDVIGGKAKNLFYLQSHGLNVPDFICVSSTAFEETIGVQRDTIKTILAKCDFDSFESVQSTSDQLVDLVLSQDIPTPILEEIESALVQLEGWSSFSVRSSALNEDGLTSSYAGQLGTWLNVTRDSIIEKLKLCWASAFQPGILTYVIKMNQDPSETSVAVVIQRMIDSESAGVLFQADPKGGVDKQVIAAGYGLGEGVVGDKVETDLYTHNKVTGLWHLDVNEKTSKLSYSSNEGTQECQVSGAESHNEVLSETQRNTLVHASESIASIYNHYQDVEWTFDKEGQLYILQSRPITTIPKGAKRVFDNSNIIESYPGVVLPMTFSILHLDYYHCIRDALSLFGVPKNVVEKQEEVLQNLVGYINGQSYYNICNWYRTLLVMPFFKSKIIDYFEQMIGTDGSFDSALNDIELTRFDKLRILTRFPISFIKNLVRHEHLIKGYFVTTKSIESDFKKLDLEKAGADALIEALMNLSKRFMKSLSIPILNDFFAMIFMAVTKEQFKRSGIPDSDNLLNSLLSNQHIDSTKPVKSLEGLADVVRCDQTLQTFLNESLNHQALNEPIKLVNHLNAAGYNTFASQLTLHIELYGHRSPKELIMEEMTFRENPFQLIKFILDTASLPKKEVKKNQGAEGKLVDSIKGLKNAWLLKWLLKKTRNSVAYREATRLDRGLHFSYIRQLLLAIGKTLKAEGVLDEERDVFYITLQELDQYRKGCSPNGDLKGLIEYRKCQVQKWKDNEQEGKLFTQGTVYANRFPMQELDLIDDLKVLKGTGCSEGVVRSFARTIKNPNQDADLKGKILVSETTDPGWVFLMTISAGLVSERGSLLSHTAIIGRELGIPTIVGVKNATKYIEDGSEIELNGKTGEIRLCADEA